MPAKRDREARNRVETLSGVTLPLYAWKELRRGRPVAAQLPTGEAEMSAYVMVIPRVRRLYPWQRKAWPRGCVLMDSRILPYGAYRETDNRGYEIRYLRHHVRYTELDWGYDYDLALNDETTRIKRVMVERREEIGTALRVWLPNGSGIAPAGRFDSTLVNSMLDAYLARPRERSHLWYPDC